MIRETSINFSAYRLSTCCETLKTPFDCFALEAKRAACVSVW